MAERDERARRSGVVPLLSGGLDSLALLLWLQRAGLEVYPISINYGQRHSRELDHAAAIAKWYGVEHRTVDLSGLSEVLAGSSQTSPGIEVPEGHYEDQSMRVTVVPNRNMLLISIAAGYAISKGLDQIAFAAHSGDHAVYPDCRPEFREEMGRALAKCHYWPVYIAAPFLSWTKAEIVRYAYEFKAPLSLSWSCYKGGDLHCGKCGTCVERREAFELAKVPDPTRYEGAKWSAALGV